MGCTSDIAVAVNETAHGAVVTFERVVAPGGWRRACCDLIAMMKALLLGMILTAGCSASSDRGDDTASCPQPAPEGTCQCVNGSWFCTTCPGGGMPSAEQGCTPGDSCQYEDWEHGCSCSCAANGRWHCANETIGSRCPTGGYGPFTFVEPLTSVTTTLDELAPTISADELELMFARPGPGGDLDLWRATRTSKFQDFSPAVRDAALSTAAIESDPSLASARTELLFVRGSTIFEAHRATSADPWGAATAVAELAGFTAPDFGRDDTSLVLAATGAGADVYATSRTIAGAPWMVPVALPGTQSAGGSRGPTIRTDELEVIFASTATGTSRLYQATRPVPTEVFAVAPLDLGFPATVNLRDPELSNDGSALYFAADDGGDFNLYVVRRDLN